jgi:hypothetical protein
MYYTDYEKKEIFTDRQSAINSSRIKAKDEFFDSLVNATYEYDEYGYLSSHIIRKVSDYKEIKALFEAYEKNRSTVYDVKIDLLGLF